MKRLLSFFAFAAILLTACTDSKKTADAEKSDFSLDSVRTQITASNALYGDYFGKADSAGFVSSYTIDACISPAGVPKICGREGIGLFFKEAVRIGVKRIVLTIDEVLGGKDGVVETGKYELQGEGGVSWEKGKYMVLWKQEGGKWKMFRDIWNSDATEPDMRNQPPHGSKD